ncbi:ParA family protein [Emergencia sp. 1XD21-10]|uniref:ParA family protein n=1 Tax=Emergencia sp. 1XD21-10 TaxID=2304569 RepID=UPI00137A983A|nr:ParA family protein [Emergencia sp. 1XD21-10]NCE98197.1 ParA family protein [Emergencia sp. 1XD21-10]
MTKKAQIIALANQKGGVGKTTTCHVLAYGLQDRGKKVLLIDTDPQTNLTETFSIAEYQGRSIYQLFKKEKKASECIFPVSDNLDIIPGSLYMAGADMEFSQPGREYLLKEALIEVADRYDYIIIDTPPNLGIITINVIVAAHSTIIPMKASKYSVQGLSQLLQTIDVVSGYYNSAHKIAGILITQYDGRTNIRRNIKEAIEKVLATMGIHIFNTVIRNGVAIEEVQYAQESLFTKKKTSVTEDYKKFIEELLEV